MEEEIYSLGTPTYEPRFALVEWWESLQRTGNLRAGAQIRKSRGMPGIFPGHSALNNGYIIKEPPYSAALFRNRDGWCHWNRRPRTTLPEYRC